MGNAAAAAAAVPSAAAVVAAAPAAAIAAVIVLVAARAGVVDVRGCAVRGARGVGGEEWTGGFAAVPAACAVPVVPAVSVGG